MEFIESDSTAKRHVEAWDWSRAAIASGGLLKYSNDPLVVRVAKEMLAMFRKVFNTRGFSEDSRLLKKLGGLDQDGGTPYGLRLLDEVYATIARLNEERGDKTEHAELKEVVLVLMDGEIERLTELEKFLESADGKRTKYKSSAAIISGQEAAERLLRYETHLSREVDRILNRLERLQRMRQGQPLPPRIDVNIS